MLPLIISQASEPSTVAGEPVDALGDPPTSPPALVLSDTAPEEQSGNGSDWLEFQQGLATAQRSFSSSLSTHEWEGDGGDRRRVCEASTSSEAPPEHPSPWSAPSANWLHHPKHYMILSSSGKPIYSFHDGDERELASLAALISALVSVVQVQASP